jgi:hypothetical protein
LSQPAYGIAADAASERVARGFDGPATSTAEFRTAPVFEGQCSESETRFNPIEKLSNVAGGLYAEIWHIAFDLPWLGQANAFASGHVKKMKSAADMASKERFCPLASRPSSRQTALDQAACQSDRDAAVS